MRYREFKTAFSCKEEGMRQKIIQRVVVVAVFLLLIPLMLSLIHIYVWQRKHICGVSDTKILMGKTLREREPGLNPKIRFAIYNSSAGSVCPYGLTIAYAEHAVQNGAQVSLNLSLIHI